MNSTRDEYDKMRASWDVRINTCIMNCSQVQMKDVVFGCIVDVVDQQDSTIAALTAENDRLRDDKLLMRDVCEGRDGAIREYQRQAKIEALQDCMGHSDPMGKLALERKIKALEAGR